MSRPHDPSVSNTLQRNFAALAERAPELARRLTLGHSDEHLVRDRAGRATHLRIQNELLPLALNEEDLRRALEPAPEAGPLFLFGIGAGELVERALRERPAARVVAWDRDPALLLEALSRFDFTAALRDGRLKLRYGVDLLDHLEPRTVLLHPLLARLYLHERHLLGQPLRAKRACVGLGRLFVDDLIVALRGEGYDVLPVDLEGLPIEETERTIARFQPELLAVINYTEGLAEFCEQRELELRVWEVDPSIDSLQPVASTTRHTRVHTYRKQNLDAYQRAGFEHVEHMALASDIDKRRPLQLDPRELERYAAPVSFVGSSLADSAEQLRARFEALYAQWAPDGRDGRAIVERLLEAQGAEPFRYVLPELAEAVLGPFLRAARAGGAGVDPVHLIGEEAAARRRRDLVAHLSSFGIDVWGDPAWNEGLPAGAHYRGSAGHHRELTRIYNASCINIDIGRLYQLDIVTMRVFDVLACGGFLIAEHSDELEDLFELGVELESYSSLEELDDKVRHYLARPERTRKIAARGLAAVRERHTIRQRVRRMIGDAQLEGIEARLSLGS